MTGCSVLNYCLLSALPGGGGSYKNAFFLLFYRSTPYKFIAFLQFYGNFAKGVKTLFC